LKFCTAIYFCNTQFGIANQQYWTTGSGTCHTNLFFMCSGATPKS
jgi:hypothetical protein